MTIIIDLYCLLKLYGDFGIGATIDELKIEIAALQTGWNELSMALPTVIRDGLVWQFVWSLLG